ncbi:MAG: hypothetical protein PHQ11_01505 [Paludibacter sp.]|nr:hypothetical protein [Paludibacter sp.]MDD4198696.1 hypothetical protein [Paludibacter sp.]MDD4427114.1 hypothetical protein [Paludibacter sp.]
MKHLKKILGLAVLILGYTFVNAQSNDSLFYRHSLQLNLAGLGIERWGMAYELRVTSRHALFVQVGGSFPIICNETEYGSGLHYKYFLRPVQDAKFLWLFKSAYKTTFGDINIRYMNLAKGIYKGAQYSFESYNIGVGVGQTWVWNKGFTISYWLGYGPPIVSEYKWKETVPTDGDSWAKMYKWTAGLDFGLSIGYSFGSQKNNERTARGKIN